MAPSQGYAAQVSDNSSACWRPSCLRRAEPAPRSRRQGAVAPFRPGRAGRGSLSKPNPRDRRGDDSSSACGVSVQSPCGAEKGDGAAVPWSAASPTATRRASRRRPTWSVLAGVWGPSAAYQGAGSGQASDMSFRALVWVNYSLATGLGGRMVGWNLRLDVRAGKERGDWNDSAGWAPLT